MLLLENPKIADLDPSHIMLRIIELKIRYPGLHPRDLIFLEPADITKHDPSVTLPGTLRVAQHVLKGVAEVSSEAEEDVIFATSSLTWESGMED